MTRPKTRALWSVIRRPPERKGPPGGMEESLDARKRAALATSSCLAYFRKGVSSDTFSNSENSIPKPLALSAYIARRSGSSIPPDK